MYLVFKTATRNRSRLVHSLQCLFACIRHLGWELFVLLVYDVVQHTIG